MAKASAGNSGRGARAVLLTPDEVVERMGGRITTKTLSNWRSESGKSGPPFKKLGNRIYYPEDWLDAWDEGNKYNSTRDYREKEPETISPPQAIAPPLNPADALIAEFDDMVAQLREALVARIADLATSTLPPKRPRGRPRGSKNKTPPRKPGARSS